MLRLEQAFERLPEEDREVIGLCRIAGLSREDVGQRMGGRAAGAVRSLLTGRWSRCRRSWSGPVEVPDSATAVVVARHPDGASGDTPARGQEQDVAHAAGRHHFRAARRPGTRREHQPGRCTANTS